MFRDGAPAHEKEAVFSEINSIKSVLSSLLPKNTPKLTYIGVIKRHKIRGIQVTESKEETNVSKVDPGSLLSNQLLQEPEFLIWGRYIHTGVGR